MQLNRLLVFGFLFLTRVLHAQTDFRPGFIINATGDTLHGQIDYRGDLLMTSVCKFKRSDNTVTEYSPNDLAGYRFIDSKYFVSKEVKGKKSFLEYLIKGKINLYYMRDGAGDHYYIQKDGEQLMELPYESGIKVVGDKQVYYESTKHIGILSYYMHDAPSLKSEIESMHEPDHKNLIKIAKDYHHVVCKDQECIIYGKKESTVHVLTEAYVGVARLNSYNAYLNELGGFFYVSIPRTNEKVFFKTGLLYDFSSKIEDRIKAYRIPLHIQYIYRVHRIQPKVSGGFNLLHFVEKDVSVLTYFVSFNLGVDFKITNKLALTSTINTDNTPFGYILLGATRFNMIYSINVGLRWDLK